MKLKRIPEDFQVEELTTVVADGGGFALYCLTKRSLGTPEAIEAIARCWNLPRHCISYGGLKDKHALTRQYVTVRHGLRRGLEQPQFELQYLGQTARAFTPHDIAGNRFNIVLRDLSVSALAQAEAALGETLACGLPNYFDDQRFGSVGESREFIAHPWCLGNYERALWLALADAHPHDRPDEREQKRLIREYWGRWPECKAALARSNRRSIITYLADKPGDFKGAFARMRADLRGIYLAAFQSFLWNRLLAAQIRQAVPADQLCHVPLEMEPAPFFRTLDPGRRAELAAAVIPLPSARSRWNMGLWLPLLEQILAEFGMELRQLRVKHPRDSFFSKGSRAALIAPAAVGHRSEPDELYPRRHKLALQFELPRGAYATILVKRLTEC